MSASARGDEFEEEKSIGELRQEALASLNRMQGLPAAPITQGGVGASLRAKLAALRDAYASEPPHVSEPIVENPGTSSSVPAPMDFVPSEPVKQKELELSSNENSAVSQLLSAFSSKDEVRSTSPRESHSATALTPNPVASDAADRQTSQQFEAQMTAEESTEDRPPEWKVPHARHIHVMNANSAATTWQVCLEALKTAAAAGLLPVTASPEAASSTAVHATTVGDTVIRNEVSV